MKYTIHENLSEKKGVVSNLHGFFNRHMDTGFKTKWSGYWTPPRKFLDYYGLKINGLWLNNNTVKAVEYGDVLRYYHETDTLEITEEVSTPDDLAGFKTSLEIKNKTEDLKAVQIVLEPGIDIRERSDDLGPSNYTIEHHENRLTVSNSIGKLYIKSREEFHIKDKPIKKTHFPGDERQTCFIPGKLVFRKEIEPGESEKLEINFQTSENKPAQLETVEQRLEGRLDRTFNSSIQSIENLVYEKGDPGIIAGHPWFQNYWARDSFWSVLGLIDAGYFDLSERILESFAEKDLPGKIKTNGELERVDRSDTAPLYVIASEKLRLHHGITETIKKGREKAMEELELEDGVVQHDPAGTWMDTIERGPAIDIQSLWLEAAKITNDNREKQLRKGLEKFKEDGILKDELENSADAVNTVIPLMFGQIDKKTAEEQLEKINGEFCSRYGARTRSATDLGYNAEGYHTGSCWGLTTCWAAMANIRYGNYSQGSSFLEKLEQFLDRNQPGALPEVVNAETGESLGCSEQAWSAGLFVHAIDSYLLGINVKEDVVEINPSPNVEMTRKGKMVRGEKLDIRVSNGEVEVLNSPDIELRL